MPDSPIPQMVIRFLVAVLALVAIVAFAVIFGKALADVQQAADGQTPTTSEAFLYFATAIGALVGGIVAVGFGVSPPSLTGKPTVRANVTGVGSLALPIGAAIRAIIGSLYAIIYVVAGIVAAVIWVANPNETSNLVKNLATTFAGLVVPIVGGYFKV